MSTTTERIVPTMTLEQRALAKLILTAAEVGLNAGLVGLHVATNRWAPDPTGGYQLWVSTEDSERCPRLVARLELHFREESES